MKTTTILLSEEDKEKAKELSKKIFGRENLSALISYLINNHDSKEN